ncbi:MAG TPA: hypothetical protein VHZ96_00310 [Frankiaceae bacterium]|jgi:hypothetical protein|nr:hypothetical protein [Frankiaceae bacterium]
MTKKRFIAPVLAGVVVFGAVTAFAAGFTVTSKTVVSGNATVSACNAGAAVSYTTAWDATVPGYVVSTAPITTAAGCGLMAYKVTLTGAAGVSLAEQTGSLIAAGSASPNFATNKILAANVVGISVTITG